MTKRTKKKLIRIYEIMLPILALFELLSLISSGSAHFRPQEQSTVIFIIDHAAWLIFVMDYTVRMVFTENKKHFFTSHLAEFVAIVPIGPLIVASRMLHAVNMGAFADGALKIAFIIKFFSYLIRTYVMQRRFIKTNQLHYTAAISLTSLVVAAMLFADFENRSYSDGIWWAFVTASTTGFGDVVPTTQGGRIVGMFLMVVGLSCISMLTGVIAGRMMQSDSLRETEDKNLLFVQHRLSKLDTLTEREVDELCAMLKAIKSSRNNSVHELHNDSDRRQNENEFISAVENTRFSKWIKKTFKRDPEDDDLLEKNL